MQCPSGCEGLLSSTAGRHLLWLRKELVEARGTRTQPPCLSLSCPLLLHLVPAASGAPQGRGEGRGPRGAAPSSAAHLGASLPWCPLSASPVPEGASRLLPSHLGVGSAWWRRPSPGSVCKGLLPGNSGKKMVKDINNEERLVLSSGLCRKRPMQRREGGLGVTALGESPAAAPGGLRGGCAGPPRGERGQRERGGPGADGERQGAQRRWVRAERGVGRRRGSGGGCSVL